MEPMTAEHIKMELEAMLQTGNPTSPQERAQIVSGLASIELAITLRWLIEDNCCHHGESFKGLVCEACHRSAGWAYRGEV